MRADFQKAKKNGANLNSTRSRGIFIAPFDVTETVEAQEKLEESTRKYRELFETSIDGIVAADLEGHILDCNEAYQRMVDYSKDELKKLTFTELTPKKWRMMEAQLLREQLHNKGLAIEYEKELIRKDGSMFPVSIRAWPIRDDGGNIVGMWCIARDITEVKALRENEVKYRRLVENMQEGIWVIDKNMLTSFVNPAMTSMLGYTEDELMGQPLPSFMDESGAEIFKCNLERRKQDLKETDFEFLRKDGSRISASVAIRPIVDENGNDERTLVIVTDITNRKRMESSYNVKLVDTTGKHVSSAFSIAETLEALSFRLFGGIARSLLKHVHQLKGRLERAGIKIYPETYVSLMFFTATLTIPISLAAVVLFCFFGLMPLIFLVPSPLYVIAGFLVMPMSKASDRATGLEREMPFVAAYISVMASGGIAPYNSFKRLSEVELMPAMRGEAREIAKDVEIFGIDPLTALENAAKKNPLDIFRDFLSGYVSTVIIGGDIGHFLERKAEDVFKIRALRVKSAAERLGMLLETFIIVMVMMSLCFYILFSVDAIYGMGVSLYSGIILYTYLFTPLLSMLFIYLAHSMQPKTPIADMRPYKVFGVCTVIAVVIFLLLTNFMGYVSVPFFSSLQTIIDLPMAVTIGLFTATAPAAILHMKLSKEKNSMEAGVASFLRDLTEVRKTGLSPEKCIESLGKRDYGTFSKELRRISSEISWGVPAKKVIMDFLKRTRSWMTQLAMFLLVETIDVGGGTIAMIESLARFNNLTQEVEKEKKMAVRPYIMMPYLASILLVATTIMMMAFTTGTLTAGMPGQMGQQKDFSAMKTIFLTSVIFHSYLIGIVAGKISDESIASGFKHASILVVIAALVAKLTPMLIEL